ncbi:hypothetical protein PENSPDRAFT_658681 [Peniophora sp. CONT]|nr:hypothetical protein PENSPDRAFT_658681 [Peniophora sp. CONT]
MLIKEELTELEAVPEPAGNATSGSNVVPPPRNDTEHGGVKKEMVDEDSKYDKNLEHDDVPPLNLNDLEGLEEEFNYLKQLILDFKDVHSGENLKLLNVCATRAEEWNATTDTLLAKEPSKIRIGIYGASGTGKSSLLNCAIGRNLLMAAGNGKTCTAFVSRVTYSESAVPTGEVTFIKRHEWKAEIEAFVDMLADSGLRQAQRDSRTWFKLKAVYPGIEDALRNGTVETAEDILARDQGLNLCLGETLQFTGKDAQQLNQSMIEAVRRKSDLDPDMMDIDGLPEPSFWPLVQESVVGCKCDLLKYVDLIDFPGTGDINKARGEIALNYLAKLDHVFVTSLASRACDSNAYSGLFSGRSNDTMEQGLRQIISDHFNLTLVATQGDTSLTLGEAHHSDDDSQKAVKQQYRKLQAQIDELRCKIKESQPRSSATSSLKRTRTGSFSESAGPPAAKRHQTSSQGDVGMRLDIDHSEADESPDGLLARVKVLREQQDLLRPMVRRLAAVERIKTIEEDWPTNFVEAISTGEDGIDVVAPVAIVTSVETYDMTHHVPDFMPIRDCDEAGIETLQRHIQGLAVGRVREFLKSYTQDVQAHADNIQSFLDSTGSFFRRLPDKGERPHDIERLENRLCSSLRAGARDDYRGLEATAFQGLDNIATQYGSELALIFSQKLAGGLHKAAVNAQRMSNDKYTELGGTLRWNTHLAVMRRDGVFREENWNEELVSSMKGDTTKLWAKTFTQEDPAHDNSRLRRDLFAFVAATLRDVRVWVERHEDQGMDDRIGWMVNEFTKRSEDKAKSAVGEALKAAQAQLTEGQKSITRAMAPTLQYELSAAYVAARTTPRGQGFMGRMKTSFRDELKRRARDAFTAVADKTMVDLGNLVTAVTSELRSALRICAAKMEGDMSVIWTEKGVEYESQLMVRNLAYDCATEALDHIKRSPFKLQAKEIVPPP